MTIADRIIVALGDAAAAGIEPAAVVLGAGQLVDARRERDRNDNYIWSFVGAESKLLNLPVLTSPRVAGIMVVDDAGRRQFEASGFFSI